MSNSKEEKEKDSRGGMAKCPKYVLEDKQGAIGMLLKVKTSRNALKKETALLIKNQIDGRAAIGAFDKIRDKPLDIALHLSVNKTRFERQDLDNIQKVVFDAIKKDKRHPERNYLVSDDSKIIRCLVYKTKRIEDKYVDTDELTISFREHNPEKQMILEKESGIIVEIKPVKYKIVPNG